MFEEIVNNDYRIVEKLSEIVLDEVCFLVELIVFLVVDELFGKEG